MPAAVRSERSTFAISSAIADCRRLLVPRPNVGQIHGLALLVIRNRIFALGAASPGPLGGYRALMALRQVLELGCGATVLPEQVAVRDAANAFDADDNLRDARNAEALKALLRRLVDAARYLR